jgi:hypothetical protein
MDMKRKIKYFLLSLLLLVQFSCNDALQILPPSGVVRAEFWKTRQDVESVLMAAYGSFAKMDGTLFLQGELRGDLIMGGASQRSEEQRIMEANIYPDNTLCNWKAFYEIINNCNEVIKNAPLVQDSDDTFTDFQMQGLSSEAYFLRSLSYFYMVRIFKEVPLILGPSENDNVEFFQPKSSEAVILEQIVNDLNANRDFAPSSNFSAVEDNKGRASKASYDALLADIALWQFEYDEVLKHVQKIEANEELFLMPDAYWFEIFYPGNSLESIFEFQFDDNLGQRNSTYNLTSESGRKYKPSQAAIAMFDILETGEFVRGEGASISEVGENEFVIWKYVGRFSDGESGRSGSDRNSCNWIVYRYSEVLLMKAEALSQLGRYDEALEIINEIRERANVAPRGIAYNPVAFEDAILEEKALEFAYEGKRWFDLLRMGRRNNYARKSKLIEIIVRDVPSAQKRVLASKLTNPLGWYLPIYFEEMERNKNLVQNPYYNF